MRYRAPATSGHLLIAVDPGGRRADGRRCGVSVWTVAPSAGGPLAMPEGVAVYGDTRRGALLGAGHVPLDQIGQWVSETAGALAPRPVAWVVEKPHLRGDQHAQRRGVEALRRTVATLRRRRTRASTWREVRPSAWKGNVPKDVHHRRVLRVLVGREMRVGRCLDPDGAAYQPDAADAVALGLWALGRTGRGGVRPSRGV